MTHTPDQPGSEASSDLAGCGVAALAIVAVIAGIALFLLKYGMTLSMLWWESR